MFEFVLGAAAVVLGIKVWRHRGFGWGFGHHPGDGERGPRWFLRGIYRRLQTSPSQERIIEAAVDRVTEVTRHFRDQRRRFREDLAQALKGDTFDAKSLDPLFTQLDTLLADLRKTFIENLAQVHQTLDSRQRATLSELVHDGFWRGRGHGHHHRCHGDRSWRDHDRSMDPAF